MKPAFGRVKSTMATEDGIMRDKIVKYRPITLPGLAVAMAGLFVTPASAGVVSQTLSYGPSSSPWTHTFAFTPFVPPTGSSKLTGVHLDVTGTQTTKNGLLDCVFGDGGMGLGTQNCSVTAYHQTATFSLLSPPLFSKNVNDLTVQQAQSYVTPLQVLEDNDFGLIINGQSLAGMTVVNTYNFYNSVASTGGTLDPSEFIGAGPINLTYQMTPSSGVDLMGGGSAGLSFDSILYSLSLTLTYDFVETNEPSALAILGIAVMGIAWSRRRARAE